MWSHHLSYQVETTQYTYRLSYFYTVSVIDAEVNEDITEQVNSNAPILYVMYRKFSCHSSYDIKW